MRYGRDIVIPGSILLGLALTGTAVADGRGGHPPDWSYSGDSGPGQWGALGQDYATCASGQAQSPIDIRYAQPTLLTPLNFQYRSNALSLRQADRGIIAEYEPGSYVRIGPARFELTEVRFHAPAEHAIGGRRQALEIQLMHEDESGRKLGIAVGVREGSLPNGIFERLAEHIPQDDWEHYENGHVGINATFLLPPRRSYFTYVGSLTVPPCTEGVSWIVFKNPLEARTRDVRRLTELLEGNARPLQPVNQRRVLDSR